MKERPILFSVPMVRAILDGRKAQTRRELRHDRSPEWSHEHPLCHVGDRLWVRETWAPVACPRHDEGQPPGTACRCREAVFRVGYGNGPIPVSRWRPSIHMPRWASRLTLEVTGVRVERLNDISEADAKAEGVQPVANAPGWYHGDGVKFLGARPAFVALWESINGAGSWAKNPWVWVVSFRRLP